MNALHFGLCNEVLQPTPFEQQCRLAAALGYDGLEVAPFTLAADPRDITDTQAGLFRRMAQDQGLTIDGLHWLLVAPPDLSIVSEDQAVRDRTVAFMRRLVELCALMGGKYLVHGSPKQRSVPPGSTREQALARATECFAQAGSTAAKAGVVYCIEPLSSRETNLLNTVAEAVRIVDEVGSPGLKTMIDCSAAGQMEKASIPDLLAHWVPTGHVAHVQVNDPNRRGPGQGEMAFAPIIGELLRLKRAGQYKGVVAVEPFDYLPDGPGCAARAIGYLKGVAEGLQRHG